MLAIMLLMLGFVFLVLLALNIEGGRVFWAAYSGFWAAYCFVKYASYIQT